MMKPILRIVVLLFINGWSLTASTDALAEVPGYPENVNVAQYHSKGDGTLQPTLIWHPKTDVPVPLLVALHTWSSDYRQAGGEAQYANWCQRAGWAFLHPNFRGINKTPAALGSDLVVADILSAVEYAKSQVKIDPNRIYCVGVSGGGHASMLMAARAPNLWAGVSAWCGISDIAAWHQQCRNSSFDRYASMIESAIGDPSESLEKWNSDASHRSPLHWIRTAKTLPPLDINHGINDGRAGSVPFTHSILAWNAAVSASAAIPLDTINTFYESQQVPFELQRVNVARPDDLMGKHQPIFRCVEGDTRLTIFDGGHEIVHDAALNWLAGQVKGSPVQWNPGRSASLKVDASDQQSGK